MNKKILKFTTYIMAVCAMSFIASCDDEEDNVYSGVEQPADSFFNSTPISTGSPLSTNSIDMTKIGVITGDPIEDPVKMDSIRNVRKQVIVNAIQNMVFVNGSSFLMGATKEQGSNVHVYEKNLRKVTLSDYYISKFQVTQELYQIVMGGNNQASFKEKGNLNMPIDNRLYSEMQSFLTKFNSITGLEFSLPTEAQWEFAARGGRLRTENTLYPGSNNIEEIACYWNNNQRIPQGDSIVRRWPVSVGLKNANALGIYDMAGNVAEACQDWYAPYELYDETDPTGPASLPEGSLQKKVCRGGGWATLSDPCRVSARSAFLVTSRFNYIGFRLVHPKVD